MIVSALCRTMPTYVPSGVPAEPIASEKRLPPISTSKPRARTASSTASIVRGETDDSTKIAGIRRDAIRSASRWTSFAPASEAVEIPWRPTTSKP